MSKLSIALIGVGEMGKGIGHNILENGHTLFLSSGHSIANVSELKRQGAVVVNDFDELCRNVSIIILCLPSSKEVKFVCLGKDGLLQKIKRNSLIIDCSTSWPSSTISLANRFNKKGVIFMDAPLTRTPIEAMEGRLNCIVGGTKNSSILANKVLSFFCENIFYADRVGDANKIKLLNNGLSLCAAAFAGEIVHTAIEMKVDLYKLREVVSAGGANSAQFQGMMKWLMEDDKKTLNFSLVNAIKDLKYLKKIASIENIKMPMVKEVNKKYRNTAKAFGRGVTLPYLCGYSAGSFKK